MVETALDFYPQDVLDQMQQKYDPGTLKGFQHEGKILHGVFKPATTPLPPLGCLRLVHRSGQKVDLSNVIEHSGLAVRDGQLEDSHRDALNSLTDLGTVLNKPALVDDASKNLKLTPSPFKVNPKASAGDEPDAPDDDSGDDFDFFRRAPRSTRLPFVVLRRHAHKAHLKVAS